MTHDYSYTVCKFNEDGEPLGSAFSITISLPLGEEQRHEQWDRADCMAETQLKEKFGEGYAIVERDTDSRREQYAEDCAWRC